MREKTPRLQEQVSDGKRLPHECSETVAKANAMDLVYIFDLTAGVYFNFSKIYIYILWPEEELLYMEAKNTAKNNIEIPTRCAGFYLNPFRKIPQIPPPRY